MNGVFFYTISIAFASGILFRSFLYIEWGTLFFFILVAGAATVLWVRSRREPSSPFLLLAVTIFCFTLGALRFDVSNTLHEELEARVGEKIYVEGIIAREPEVRESSTHLYVRLEETDELILVSADRFQPFAYGERIAIEGVLKKPEAFETEYGRTFDYPGYLRAKGVSYMISYGKVEVTESGQGNSFLAALFKGKQRFTEAIEAAIPEPESGLGLGLLLGAKRALGEDLENAFRRVGIIHIVVLSGYNIMLVAEAIMRLLSSFFRPRMRMLIGIIAIICFAILVGLSATVVRATIMAALVLVARTTGRQYAVMRALMITGLCMLLINPYLLAFDPGFQLSFLATMGLILVSPIIEARLITVPTRFQIREFLTATLSTQIFLLPFLTYLIGTFSVVSVLVNVLVLPVVPVAMFLAFMTGIISVLIPALGVIVALPASAFLGYIIFLAEQFSRLPFASFSVPQFSFLIVVLSYVAIAFGIFYLTQKKKDESMASQNASPGSFDDWTIIDENETLKSEQVPSASASGSFPFR